MSRHPSRLYDVETEQEWRRQATRQGALTPSDLGEAQYKSTSGWGHKHMLAYRLSITETKNILPTIANHHRAGPTILQGISSGDDVGVNLDNLNQLLYGPKDLLTATESEILARPHGHFWLALAQAARLEELQEARSHPSRARTQVIRPGFVDSGNISDSSSSGGSQGSSTGSTFSTGDPSDVVDATYDDFEADDDGGFLLDDNDDRRYKPELFTVQLIVAFLRCAVNAVIKQGSQSHHFSIRVIPLKSSMQAGPNSINVKTEDDGGISLLTRTVSGWVTGTPYIALLEAKRAFVRDTNSKPTMTNQILAQYLGEAVITWKAHMAGRGNDIFIIAAANTWARIIHFKFGTRYREFLNANKQAQENMAWDDSHVTMYMTRWFNLQSKQGRALMLYHVLALLDWWRENEGQN